MSHPTPGHSLEVLLIAERTPPAIGGKESVLAELLRHSPGDRTQLVAPGLAGAVTFDRSVPVAVRRRPTFVPAPLQPFIRRKHLDWTVKRRRPDLVVAFGLKAEGTMALRLKRELEIPFIFHLDATELVEARRDIRSGSEKGARMQELLDESEAIVCATRDCRLEAYRAGVLPHHLQVVRIGVDLQRFRPGPRDESLARKLELGQGPVLLTVGGSGNARDPETVFKAFSALRTKHQDARLVVVGRVDGAAWRAALRKLRIDRSVRFVGSVSPKDLPEYYRLAQVFVAAHRERREDGVVQGPEVTLVEALASGLPVVATRTPITEELLGSEEAGRLVEPEAHAKFSQALADLLESPETMKELGEAARECAQRDHDAKAAGQAFREFLEVVYFRRLGLGRLDVQAPSVEGTARPAA